MPSCSERSAGRPALYAGWLGAPQQLLEQDEQRDGQTSQRHGRCATHALARGCTAQQLSCLLRSLSRGQCACPCQVVFCGSIASLHDLNLEASALPFPTLAECLTQLPDHTAGHRRNASDSSVLQASHSMMSTGSRGLGRNSSSMLSSSGNMAFDPKESIAQVRCSTSLFLGMSMHVMASLGCAPRVTRGLCTAGSARWHSAWTPGAGAGHVNA
jgi:hypothetical protein